MKTPDLSNLAFLCKGPEQGAWRGQFLKCPGCGDFVQKKGYGSCSCGTIAVDGEALRVTIKNVSEAEVEQWVEVSRLHS